MTVPKLPEKLDHPSVVTAERTIEHFYDETPTAPDRIVLCFDDDLFEHVRSTYDTTPFEAFGTGAALATTDGRVGVVRVPGVGGPATSLTMEVLIAQGATTFCVVGFAGSLRADLTPGDVVLVDRALRDEGTSHHYLESRPYVDASESVRRSLEAALEGDDYAVGATWTTDAPYRETAAEVERYREDGVLTVDMEAATTFAIAARRDVEAGAIFTISDVLDPDGWEPSFEETRDHLERGLAVAIEAIG